MGWPLLQFEPPVLAPPATAVLRLTRVKRTEAYIGCPNVIADTGGDLGKK